MSEETNTTAEPIAPQYTQEELTVMRTKMTKFYQEEIKYLKLQENYEKLVADIEEHKTRRYTMMLRSAHMMHQGVGKDAPEEEPETSKPEKDV